MSTVKFLNTDGLAKVRNWTLGAIESETIDKMIFTITDTSTNEQIPGAKAVFDFVTDEVAALVNLRLEIVTELPQNPETNVVYLVRANDETSSYSMHSWISGAWVNLGNFEVDLSNYWSKDELVPLTNQEIDDILNGD